MVILVIVLAIIVINVLIIVIVNIVIAIVAAIVAAVVAAATAGPVFFVARSCQPLATIDSDNYEAVRRWMLRSCAGVIHSLKRPPVMEPSSCACTSFSQRTSICHTATAVGSGEGGNSGMTTSSASQKFKLPPLMSSTRYWPSSGFVSMRMPVTVPVTSWATSHLGSSADSTVGALAGLFLGATLAAGFFLIATLAAGFFLIAILAAGFFLIATLPAGFFLIANLATGILLHDEAFNDSHH